MRYWREKPIQDRNAECRLQNSRGEIKKENEGEILKGIRIPNGGMVGMKGFGRSVAQKQATI
jgi:hypothetical protein